MHYLFAQALIFPSSSHPHIDFYQVAEEIATLKDQYMAAYHNTPFSFVEEGITYNLIS